MNKIEIGEYIRTRKGIIDKVIIDYFGICNSPNCNCKHVSCQYDYYDEEDIVKHSKNIIDLIELGDILEIKEGSDICYLGLKKDTITANYKEIIEGIKNKEVELLSILTKEQYKQNYYKVEVKDEQSR